MKSIIQYRCTSLDNSGAKKGSIIYGVGGLKKDQQHHFFVKK